MRSLELIGQEQLRDAREFVPHQVHRHRDRAERNLELVGHRRSGMSPCQ